MSEDYYIVLGISRGADLNKIKRAYRKIAKQHHPDITQSKENAERFIEVRKAYETLADEDKRRKYDAELEEKGSRLKVSEVPKTIQKRTSLFREMDQFSTFVDEFFEGFVPGFFHQERGGMSGKDLYYEVILSPAEAFEGGLFPITVPVIEPCPRCDRSGEWEGFFCPVCYGYGRIRGEREFSLSIPPRIKHGTKASVSLEDIGLKDTILNVLVLIDPDL
jgi:DnaJ-class molecular chaperone